MSASAIANLKYEAAVALRKANPYLTLEQIGQQLGVTRERVRQYLKAGGVPTKAKRDPYCCAYCGTPIIPRGDKIYCSVECRQAAIPKVVSYCDWCGAELVRPEWKENIRRRHAPDPNNLHHFCNKTCHGKWLAREHGFLNPDTKRASEDALRARGKLRAEKLKSLRLDNPTWTTRRLARETGLSMSGVYAALRRVGMPTRRRQ